MQGCDMQGCDMQCKYDHRPQSSTGQDPPLGYVIPSHRFRNWRQATIADSRRSCRGGCLIPSSQARSTLVLVFWWHA